MKKIKKTLLIALLLVPFLGISQTKKPIDGFLGIKFGSSKAAVIAALNAKKGVLSKAETTATTLVYKNLKLGSRDVRTLFVEFTDNKAYQAQFVFDPGEEAHTIEYYYSLVNDLNEVYGTGNSTKTFKEPYKESDEDYIKINAISHGNAEYVTEWKSDDNDIQAYIAESLTSILFYTDGKLSQLSDSKKKDKEKADY